MCQKPEIAKMVDWLEEWLHSRLVEAAECNNRFLQFICEKSKWNAQEIECARVPAKMGTALVDPNKALLMSIFLSVSFGVDLPRVEVCKWHCKANKA